jgi:hypothetical protein
MSVDDEVAGEVLAQERAVWQALVDGDAATDGALLAKDFVGLYPTGFAGRDDHTSQLVGGPTVARYALSDVRPIQLAPGVVLLAYRAEFVRTGSTEVESMFVSSIWSHVDGAWRNVFSQDTPDTGEPVV